MQKFPKRTTWILPLLLFAVFFVLPVGCLFANAWDKKADFSILFNLSVVYAARNTFYVAIISSVLSVVYAFLLNYLLFSFASDREKSIAADILALPIMLPTISSGIIMVFLFGRNGFITNITSFDIGLYGIRGIVLSNMFYGIPLAFLIIKQSFLNIDTRLINIVKVSGGGSLHTLRDIIFPFTRKSVKSALFVTFSLMFTDFGVPLAVGGNTPMLSMMFYKSVVGLYDFGRGAILSIYLFIPPFLLAVFDNFKTANGHFTYTSTSMNYYPKNRGIFRMVAFWGMTSLLLLPMIFFVIAPFLKKWPYDSGFTFEHLLATICSSNFSRPLFNTLIIASCSSVFGVTLAVILSYGFSRISDKIYLLRISNLFGILTLGVPGLALGFGYVILFKGTFIYNTLAIIIASNVIHFFATPYLMSINYFSLLNPNIENVTLALGGKRRHGFYNVVSRSRVVIGEMLSFYFINSTITISAISFLANANTKTLSLYITSFTDMGNNEGALVVSLIILLMNVAFKYAIRFLLK